MINFSLGHDVNGNKVLKVKVPNKRQFSIQTLGQLPLTHKMRNTKDYETIKAEMQMYLAYFGTESQKLKVIPYL